MPNQDLCPHLDHVFLTVDRTTVEAIERCPFLAQERFGRFRVKNATSTLIGPYRTANVAGRSTFIEFFPDDAPPFPGVRLGLVLSFERPGQSAAARARLEQAGIPVHHELVRRAVAGHPDPQPWYDLLRPDFGQGSPLTLFLSQITPEYFDRIGARRTSDGRQSREAYLAAAMKAAQSPDHYFADIRRVALRQQWDRADMLARVLTTLGYTQEAVAGAVRLHGPEASIDIHVDAHAPEGLLELELALTRPCDQDSLSFGAGSELLLGRARENVALWRFAPELTSQEAPHA